MPPTLKETAIALLGAAIMLVAMPFIIFAGMAEFAVVLYVIDQVRE